MVFREVGSYGSEWEQVGDAGNTSIESNAIGVRTYLSGLKVLNVFYCHVQTACVRCYLAMSRAHVAIRAVQRQRDLVAEPSVARTKRSALP